MAEVLSKEPVNRFTYPKILEHFSYISASESPFCRMTLLCRRMTPYDSASCLLISWLTYSASGFDLANLWKGCIRLKVTCSSSWDHKFIISLLKFACDTCKLFNWPDSKDIFYKSTFSDSLSPPYASELFEYDRFTWFLGDYLLAS